MNNQIQNQILVVTADPQANLTFEQVLKPAGYKIVQHASLASAKNDLELIQPVLVIVSEKLPDGTGLELAAYSLRHFPALPVILYALQVSPALLRGAMHEGVCDTLCAPLTPDGILQSVQRSLQQAGQRREWILLEARRQTTTLNRQVFELETLARLGRQVTSSLDQDSVLTAVVDAAVQLTGAEEGSLLLLDESTGELYVRAARNFNEEFVRTFRLPVQDSLAGSVLRSGQPILLDENTPQKIKTSYLVHSLLYVPLQINGHVFGVLGVDNRSKRLTFKDHHTALLATLAEYAVIAIENARRFALVSLERGKLETLLARLQDGVIVLDPDQRLVIVNQAARQAFNLDSIPLQGKPFSDIFSQPELAELMDTSGRSLSNRVEINSQDGRVFIALLTPIAEVGTAITLHDITNLKKLDHLKSDFVSAVSHDLRSPLTAVLGYVELVERAGPVNALQREYIQHVQGSVYDITRLIDNLVNLDRIEAGFDTRKENLQVDRIIRLSAEAYKKQLAERGHALLLEIPDGLPAILGNPVQIRQAVDHLFENAIKYTRPGGKVTVQAEVEQSQLILQFRDNGIGVPAPDLPFIFDKFYRAANAMNEVGAGLGLAIVKSVIESHLGRIWVDSILSQGSTFTVVLPLAETFNEG